MSARRGISLVGILVATVLFSVTLIPLFMLFQSSRQTTMTSIQHIVASQLVTTQIEKLKVLPFRRLERYIVNPGRPLLPDGLPDIPDIVTGPFEKEPEQPDIVEEALLSSSGVTYDRLSYIAYFPKGNPDPSLPDFRRSRQRIRIRVVVRWKEPEKGEEQTRKLAMATIVQSENYHPKPDLRWTGP